jgi:hypothetical protein
MNLKEAYDLGAFGAPSVNLWAMIENMPRDLLDRTFAKWTEKKIDELKKEIELASLLISRIEEGFER